MTLRVYNEGVRQHFLEGVEPLNEGSTLVHKNKYDFTFYYSLIQNNILAEGLPSAAQDFENILSEKLGLVRSNFT